MTAGNLPEKKFSTGAISATVWKNQLTNKQNEPFEFRTIQLDRRYQDKEGNWKSTNSMRVNDIPKAVLVLQKTFEYVVLKEQQPIQQQGSGEYNQPKSGEDIQTEEIVM